MPPSRSESDPLRRRLLERVRRSIERHRDYTTVRRDAAEPVEVAPGVTARCLRQGPQARVEWVRLAAGATLPWPVDAFAQELLVLDGVLRVDSAGTPIVARDHLVRARDDAPALAAGAAGAEVYVRHCCVPVAELPALEARWWRLDGGTQPVRHAGRRWAVTGPGVEVLPLRGDREVVSMLVRFAPGASVADHHHALDEDCLVLEGEMFLGDVLLRAGDYQLAPAGGGHWGETSDVGVVFFFHGALDPVLTGSAP